MRRKKEIQYGAIPTVFNGIRYRSRLEARFAAFITLYGYWFDYESIELEHYIPDFLVELPHGTTLFECKPAVRHAEFRAPCRKITRSGWVGPAIVIGSQLQIVDDGAADLTLVGSLEAEEGQWSKVGRGRWPAAWGQYPFEDVFDAWLRAGNLVQWKPSP